MRLNCFSPPVMLATFVMEIGLALYVLLKFRALFVARLMIGMLVLLATFQLAEWMVCQGALGLSGTDWARIGFVAISLLPPLGIHMSTALAGRSQPRLVYTGYGAAALFCVYFLTTTQGFGGPVCGGNYVIFQLAPQAVQLFSAYYYALLIVGVVLCVLWSRSTPDENAASALRGLAVGYTAFMAPTTAVYIVNRSVSAGIPSIMCGFAVMLAVILVAWVLPRYLESDVARNDAQARTKQLLPN